jgi:hypothetical protein
MPNYSFRSTLEQRSAFVLMVVCLLVAGCASTPNGGSSDPPPPPAQLAVTSTSLPAGQVGTAYMATLTATGGKAPYTWTSGTLPAGLSLTASTGTIAGTPTAVASAPITFTVTDSSSPVQTKTASLTLTITAAVSTLAISTTSLPNGQVGVAYSTTLVVTGGTAPYTWSGTVPAGLSLNASTGTIAGTPTAVASAPITFTVTDSSSPVQTKTASLTLTIAAASPTLAISTTSLPAGQVGTAYSATLVATGGTTPYTWSGTVPAGLSLNSSTGAITGTPTATASAPITFTVTDSSNPLQTKTATLTLTITVAGSTLAISTTSLPSGQVGVAYNATLAATGGTTPYKWSGTVPAGLALNTSTGAITGTPTATGSAPITFTVTDSSNPVQTKTASLTLTISAAVSTLAITTTSLPAGQVGVAYNATLAATGGTTPYKWSGTVPAGLALNTSTGAITGTPTATASSPIAFTVTDSGTPVQTKTANLTLTVAAASATLTITTTTLPSGQVGTAYNTTLVATGGKTPYVWTLTSGTLPNGMGLNASTGAIAGTPTVSVTSAALTFKVTDSSTTPQSKTVNLSLTVAASTLAITTTTLPSGQVGVAYVGATLTATGGTTPYKWSGTVPAGLSLNTSTGAITGTPTATASAPITFTVTDSGSPVQTKTASLTLTVAAAVPTLTITTTTLPSGQVGVAYSATLAATGGTTPYTWTSGALPAGLQLNASTGAITGTPTATATAPITFTVTDSGSPVQTKTASLTLTVAAAVPTLTITTTTLPSGQVGTAYSTTLVATGGKTPYVWTLTSGTLPNGMGLNASTGAIAGTPTVSVTGAALTFKVTDSSATPQSKTVNLTLTIVSTSALNVSVSPKRAGLTVTQNLTGVTATTNDPSGVKWSTTGNGSFSSTTSLTGVAVTYTAPSSAGVYTVTATSATDITVSASFTVGVTDLGGVYTWHDNTNRDGANPKEYALTPSLVNTTTFGRLFNCTADAAIYAQPLWVANVNIAGGKHNVIYVVTTQNTIYAFDADKAPCQTLTSRSLLGTNETWLSNTDVNSNDVSPSIGIIGTPVIDPATSTLYVVAKSKATSGTNFIQRLHALSLTDLSERTNSPATIAQGGSGSFALLENQRAGLILSGSSVYVTWASHGDQGAYHGYIYQYDKTSLALGATYNDTPNGGLGGIWMAGAAPAVDSSGNIYCITGNGDFDATKSNYGDSFIKLNSGLSLVDYFTPTNESNDQATDADFGSGGAAILISGGPAVNLAVGGGKDGALYVLNRSNMGHFGDGNALQRIPLGGGIFSTSAFWQGSLYVTPANGHLQAYPLTTNAMPFGALSSQSSNTFGWPGATPSVSSLGSSNGIVWALSNGSLLHAYDATNLNTELWNSTMVGGDAAGGYVKFTVPTVANGKVYLGNNGQLTVYGLKAN